LLYPNAVTGEQLNSKDVMELLETNGWVNAWENGIYDFDHYHATTHEVLCVIEGSARVQFGGPNGVAVLIEAGDVAILPAGTAHKAIDCYDDFKCVGAYPEGYNYDMKYGKADEREEAIQSIRAVPAPPADPVYGLDGPLLTNWNL
jgi:uncharacterized protein YjlB